MPGSVDLFKKYINNWFIETGTYFGTGTLQAVDAGFKNVITIECANTAFEVAKNNLKNCNNVKQYLGSSIDLLPEIISAINEPITFWLDAHYTGEGSGWDSNIGRGTCPICLELEHLKTHPIKNHILLIDDTNNPGIPNYTDDRIEKIKAKCLEINSNYKFKYDHGGSLYSVLVAYIDNGDIK